MIIEWYIDHLTRCVAYLVISLLNMLDHVRYNQTIHSWTIYNTFENKCKQNIIYVLSQISHPSYKTPLQAKHTLTLHRRMWSRRSWTASRMKISTWCSLIGMTTLKALIICANLSDRCMNQNSDFACGPNLKIVLRSKWFSSSVNQITASTSTMVLWCCMLTIWSSRAATTTF